MDRMLMQQCLCVNMVCMVCLGNLAMQIPFFWITFIHRLQPKPNKSRWRPRCWRLCWFPTGASLCIQELGTREREQRLANMACPRMQPGVLMKGRVSHSVSLGGAWKSTFLTGSQVMLLLPGPHENH